MTIDRGIRQEAWDGARALANLRDALHEHGGLDTERLGDDLRDALEIVKDVLDTIDGE